MGLGAVRETGRDVSWLGAELLRTSPRQDSGVRLQALHAGVLTFLLAGAMIFRGISRKNRY